MFHNPFRVSYTAIAQQQRGSALPIALFIILVVAVLGFGMVNVLSNTNRSIINELYGARAQQAAQAGADIALTQVFPVANAINPTICSARGNPKTVVVNQAFSISGLEQCSVQVRCDYITLASPYQGVHLRFQSDGICNAGEQQVSKRLSFEAISP